MPLLKAIVTMKSFQLEAETALPHIDCTLCTACTPSKPQQFPLGEQKTGTGG